MQRKIPPYIKVCLLSTLLFGILAHGTALVTKFAMADELHLGFTVGYTVVSGRWFLEILGRIVRWFFGSPNFSLPLTGGLLTILFTGLCSCVLVRWMDLKRKVSWILTSALVIVFPVMSGLFFYNFTAPYYMFGLLLLFLGAERICKRRSVGAFALGVILILLSISIYQAFIPLLLSLLLTYFIKEVMADEQWTLKKMLLEALWYCGACITMIVLYLISVKLSTGLLGQGLLSYKGISSMGSTSITSYLQRIKLAVYLFLFPTKSDRYAFILPYRLADCYYLTLICIGIAGIRLLLKTFRQNRASALSICLAFAFFPLASNFIYVTCDPVDVYSLMQFGQLAPFLMLVCLIDWDKPQLSGGKLLRKFSALVLALFCLICVRVDNAIYTKAEFTQTRARSYFNVLVAQIKSTPGYTAATPVVYIGDISDFNDPTFRGIEGFSSLSMTPLPYDTTPFCVICAAYDWQEFLDLWCGFNPPQADAADFNSLPEVQAMPCYPDEGSIALINGTVVVKLQAAQ